MPHGTGTMNSAKLRRAMIPLAAVAFLLAQLLVGFHQHAPGHEAEKGTPPIAECGLCLAAHAPFDVAPPIELAAGPHRALTPDTPWAPNARPAETQAKHNPRAPPAFS